MRFTLRKGMAAAIALAFSQAVFAVCPADGAKPFTTGPADPLNGFASYVQDSQGLALQLCLAGNGAGICFFDPPIVNNAFSQAIGFGPEAFWWLAENAFTGPAVEWVIVMAAEAAWAAEVPGPGEQFPFTRLRTRVTTTLAGIYTVTHPWGIRTYTVPTSGTRTISEPIDIPFAPGGQGQGLVGPWLTNVGAPFTDAATPGALFVGNGTPLPVTGSPCGNNFVRVSAVALDGVTPIAIDPADADGDGSTSGVSQPLFSIFGQVYTGTVQTPLAVTGATFSRDAAGAGLLNVFSTAPTDAAVTASSVASTTDGQGHFFSSQPLTGAPPVTVDVTATAAADPLRANNLPTTVSAVPVADVVSITSAQATCTGGPAAPVCSLTVTAASSDIQGAPALTVTGFGAIVAGSLTVPGLTVVPATVTVTSAAGGSDTEPVRILNQ